MEVGNLGAFIQQPLRLVQERAHRPRLQGLPFNSTIVVAHSPRASVSAGRTGGRRPGPGCANRIMGLTCPSPVPDVMDVARTKLGINMSVHATLVALLLASPLFVESGGRLHTEDCRVCCIHASFRQQAGRTNCRLSTLPSLRPLQPGTAPAYRPAVSRSVRTHPQPTPVVQLRHHQQPGRG